MENRVTPLDKLFSEACRTDIEVTIVIPTNESGIHGMGLAQWARRKFGLVAGSGFGPFGRTRELFFCIPTKDWKIKTLRLEVIQFYILRFIEYAKLKPHRTFLVPKIGCGLAGYTPEQIAPMFRGCINLPNVYLPQEFWDVLNKEI